MKIIRFVDAQGQVGYGRPWDDSLQQAERLAGEPIGGLHPTGEKAEVRQLLAPVIPPNILCVGLNYCEHAKEADLQIPKRPVLFLKATSTLTGSEAPVVLPSISYQVDWEGELAIVIGKTALNVPESEALEFVLGYTCANDLSARDWQMHLDAQWCRGKSFDTFCPLGPVLVTADEIPDPNVLALETRLNGETMQSANTSDMIFSVKHIVSYLSQGMTLLPGTVILTGTPHGTGMAQDPPRFLRPGDICEVAIAGIGVLRNTFVSEAQE